MVGVGACRSDTSTPGGAPPQITDSADVRIVTYDHTPTAAAPFQLAPEPRYRHGANPGDYSFQEVSGGRLLPDGSAVVYDPWNAELVAFGPDGTTHEVLATEGEGPGEVSYVGAILPLEPDSILIADVWLPSYRPGSEHNSVAPYTVIAPDGEWLGAVEAPPGFHILDVAAGLVLGVERDDMDVESVVVYELVGG